jgi:Ni/Co efflux regulator RcnB
MQSRITKTLLAAATIAAVALPAGAQAKQGADDPAGHVRHAAHQTATPHKSRHHHRHHHRRADDNGRARGADDNGARRGGADDGPNHR